jgi:hypothetical protein
MVSTKRVALLGDFSEERVNLAAVAKEFNWSVCQTTEMSELSLICRSCRVAAVLIHGRTLPLPWREALRVVQAMAPEARLILCHGAAEWYSFPEMLESGAFTVLMSPLAEAEVRQALGFLGGVRQTPEGVPRSQRKIQPHAPLQRAQRAGAA